jgi:diguanylate cyclase (GGDEF)-like protein
VVDVLSAMTGATDVGILLWEPQRNEWRPAVERDGAGPSGQPETLPLSVVRYVERTREPLIVADATRDDRFARDPYFANVQACSVLAVPVLSRGGLQAVLLLENRLIRDAFPTGRLEGVMLVAGQLAISLDNAHLYSSLERKVADRTEQLEQANTRLAELSITDPLTGLANRRKLAETLDEELLRARRTRAPLSLSMVDIDHFKWYNDQHGHQAGDRCLQRVATELRHAARDSDLVARYGGEEFAVIMPATARAAARETAERLRIAISDLAEPVTDNRVVTASVGVATLDDAESQSTERLLGWADQALYDAKRNGRNRVETSAADGP